MGMESLLRQLCQTDPGVEGTTRKVASVFAVPTVCGHLESRRISASALGVDGHDRGNGIAFCRQHLPDSSRSL